MPSRRALRSTAILWLAASTSATVLTRASFVGAEIHLDASMGADVHDVEYGARAGDADAPNSAPHDIRDAAVIDAAVGATMDAADGEKPPLDGGHEAGAISDASHTELLDGDGPDAVSDAQDEAAGAEDEGEPAASDPLVLPPIPDGSPANPAVVETPVPISKPVERADRPEVVLKTIIGLITLLGLAYVGGHPRIQAWERALGISQVITAGFPFVALGVAARLPVIGILTDSVLAALGPLLRLGLGWIGLIIGFRFDARLIESLPRGIPSFAGWRGIIVFAAIVAACSVVLLGCGALDAPPLANPVFMRDALILGTAGSVTSLAAPHLLRKRGADGESVNLVLHVARVEELAGILGLLAIAAYFRPHGGEVTWQLPGTAWLLLTLGAGIAIGILVYAILLRRTTSASESLVLILGCVAFASGLASNLRLSPVVVCFVTGLLLQNFPGHYKSTLAETLGKLERPIYLVFLLVVGALWEFDDWRGWLLMVVFVAARLFGKWLGTLVGCAAEKIDMKPHARRSLTVAPLGALSIAIVVNADILYPGGSISWIVTAILGGAIVTELMFQMAFRDFRPSDPPPGDVPTDVSPPRLTA